MGTFTQTDRRTPSCPSYFSDPPSHFLFPTPRYDHTFELYSESERLYLFGTDDPESHKDWVKSIAKVSTPLLRSVCAEEALVDCSGTINTMSFCKADVEAANLQKKE